MKWNRFNGLLLSSLALCASVILTPRSAQAQTLTWTDGSGNMQWDTVSQNWSGNALWNSATPDSAIFGATGAGVVTVKTGITANDITFGSSGYTLAGSALTMGGASPSITNNGSNSILSALSGSSGVAFYGNGALLLTNNPVTGGATIYSGTIYAGATNASPGTFGGGNLTIKNGATVVIGGDNSFLGSPSATYTCTLQGSITNMGTNNGAVFGGSICKMGNLLFDGGVLYAAYPNEDYGNWDFVGNISTPGDGSSSFITGGNAALYGGSVFNIGSNDTLTVATTLMALSGDPSVLQKTGSGTLTLNGTNWYDGLSTKHTFVQMGVNIAGGLLDGNGSVAGAVTVAANGTLGAGTPSAIGQLAISNTLTLNSGSATLLRLNAAAGTNDSLVGMSTVTYGGTLVVTNLGGAFALGNTFPLFQANAYGGGFSNYVLPALPAGWSWDVSGLLTNGSITVSSEIAPPYFSLASGSFIGAPPTVVISSVTPGATIYYTTNGIAPTTSSTSGSNGVTLVLPSAVVGFTIQAFATEPGYGASAISTATYTTEPSAVWVNPSGGSWSSQSDWTNDIIPNEPAITADFSQLVLPGLADVTLGAPYTIGTLIFGDAGNQYGWELDSGAPSGVLTMAGPSPTINVSNQVAVITAGITGTSGMTVTGNGELILTSTNSISGGTVIQSGTLYADAPNASPGTLGNGNVLIKNGATVRIGGDNSFLGSATATYTCTIQGLITNWGTNNGTKFGGSICKLCNLIFDGGGLYAAYPNEDYGNWDLVGNVATPGDGSSSFITGGNAALYGGSVFNIGSNDTLTVATTLMALSGDPSVLQKTGGGTLTLNGTNWYDGLSTKHTFVPIGVNIAGGLLDGNGSVAGAVTVAANGTLGAGTPSAIGQFTVSNTLTMSSGSATLLRLNAAAGTNDSLVATSTLTYGGTLVVTNLAGTLALGNTFQLFQASNYLGHFAATNLPVLSPGLSWNWSPTNGTLSVTTSPVPVITSIGPMTGNSVSFNFSGPSGRNYTVIMTTNLALPASAWTPLTNGIFGSSPASFTDASATNAQRFYAIVSP